MLFNEFCCRKRGNSQVPGAPKVSLRVMTCLCGLLARPKSIDGTLMLIIL